MDPNQEFMALLKRAGWSQAEAARQLDLPPPQISRYLHGQNRPDRQTLRLFRLLLHDTAAPATGEAGLAEHWRQRALAAEAELAGLKHSLRQMMSERAVSSTSASDGQRLATAAGDSVPRRPAGRGKPSRGR